MGNLIIVRHGETPFNESARPDGVELARGWIDLPLTTKGLLEASFVATELQKIRFDFLYTSDLQRAKITAKHIAAKQRPPILVQTEFALRPWDIGYFTGLPVTGKDGILQEMQSLEMDAPNESAPSGESFNTFLRRYLSFLQTQIMEARTADICLVAHTRNQRVADAWIQGGMRGLYLVEGPLRAKEHLGPGEYLHYEVTNGKIRRVATGVSASSDASGRHNVPDSSSAS